MHPIRMSFQHFATKISGQGQVKRFTRRVTRTAKTVSLPVVNLNFHLEDCIQQVFKWRKKYHTRVSRFSYHVPKFRFESLFRGLPKQVLRLLQWLLQHPVFKGFFNVNILLGTKVSTGWSTRLLLLVIVCSTLRLPKNQKSCWMTHIPDSFELVRLYDRSV